MIKVFYFYFYKDKYYYSSPIINNFKILQKMKKQFLEKNIEITSILDFLPQYNNLNDVLLHNISIEQIKNELVEAMGNIIAILPNISDKYKKVIFLAFHPVPFQLFIKFNKDLKKYANVQTILWQDDLHAYFKTEETIKKLNYADHIITPSPIYFQNIYPEYLSKTSFFFYSADFAENEKFCIDWEKRIDKIILSGCVNKGYPIRADISNELVKNKKFGQICEFLKKPIMKEFECNSNIVLPYGINYYKKLGQFRGAFFGYYEYPKNFNLAKIIEILSMGCIGFFEYSPLLEKELGLIAMKHYIPCTYGEHMNLIYNEHKSFINIKKDDGKLITNIEYYKYYLENRDGKGKMIAENGKEHIRKHFSNQNGFENYVRILNNI
jgi:hypothetical protein